MLQRSRRKKLCCGFCRLRHTDANTHHTNKRPLSLQIRYIRLGNGAEADCLGSRGRGQPPKPKAALRPHLWGGRAGTCDPPWVLAHCHTHTCSVLFFCTDKNLNRRGQERETERERAASRCQACKELIHVKAGRKGAIVTPNHCRPPTSTIRAAHGLLRPLACHGFVCRSQSSSLTRLRCGVFLQGTTGTGPPAAAGYNRLSFPAKKPSVAGVSRATRTHPRCHRHALSFSPVERIACHTHHPRVLAALLCLCARNSPAAVSRGGLQVLGKGRAPKPVSPTTQHMRSLLWSCLVALVDARKPIVWSCEVLTLWDVDVWRGPLLLFATVHPPCQHRQRFSCTAPIEYSRRAAHRCTHE